MLSNTKIYKTLFFVWIGIVTVLSIIPNTPGSTMKFRSFEFRVDYLEHFAIYFILGFLFIISFPKSFKKGIFYFGTVTFLLILFSALTEYVQFFVPGRTYNPADLIYNTIGNISGILITLFYLKKKKYRENINDNAKSNLIFF